MFKIIKPQQAQHKTKKYFVQTKDRYHEEYIDGDLKVVVEVDVGIDNTVIYKDSFRSNNKKLSQLEIDIIIKRIAKGLKAMGTKLVFIEWQKRCPVQPFALRIH